MAKNPAGEARAGTVKTNTKERAVTEQFCTEHLHDRARGRKAHRILGGEIGAPEREAEHPDPAEEPARIPMPEPAPEPAPEPVPA